MKQKKAQLKIKIVLALPDTVSIISVSLLGKHDGKVTPAKEGHVPKARAAFCTVLAPPRRAVNKQTTAT